MVGDWDSDEHVRLYHGQLTELPRRTPAYQFSMQVHPELAGAKCLSGKHLNAMGLGIRHPLLPISDAPASKFGKQLRGFRTFLRKAGASPIGEWTCTYLISLAASLLTFAAGAVIERHQP